ncbi:MAG: DUF4389 domain-containing protein [Pseudomonadales bacterium]
MEENEQNDYTLDEPSIWKRALYMLLFAIIYSVSEFVIYVVVLFQLFAVVITGQSNEQLLAFGQSLSTYVYQIMRFLTFNSEQHPFPIGPWPKGSPADNPE